MPPASIRAIEPPPAPIVRISIIGTLNRQPPLDLKVGSELLLAVDHCGHIGRSPMSRVTRLGRPRTSAVRLAAITPPVGPDTAI